MTKRPTSSPLKTYTVQAEITISIWTEVSATSPEEAQTIAERRRLQRFCHECASASDGEGWVEWRTSGELDGEPTIVYIEEDV